MKWWKVIWKPERTLSFLLGLVLIGIGLYIFLAFSIPTCNCHPVSVASSSSSPSPTYLPYLVALAIFGTLIVVAGVILPIQAWRL